MPSAKGREQNDKHGQPGLEPTNASLGAYLVRRDS